MRNTHYRTWNMAGNTEKYEKLEINTAGPGLWQEKLKNVEIETQTLYDLE